MRVGIEVGGTFTDIVAVDGNRVAVAKVPSTPHSPDIGAHAAIGAAGLDIPAIADLVHGSTVATNAILERKGARIAFVTTAGFRDILFLQRHDRRNIYDLRYAKPAPPKDLKRYVWAIARLGGWKGYESKRHPGITTLWIGVKYFKAAMQGWMINRNVSTR